MTSKKLKTNLGLLKLDLMLKGVRLDESFIRKHKVRKPYELGPATFGNVDFVLPGEIYVSAPYQESFVENTPYRIRFIKNKYYLTSNQGSLPIKWISQPDYYDEPINEHVKLGDVAAVHGSYVSLSIGGHRYLQPTLVDEQGSGVRPGLVVSVDETLNILEKIRDKGKLDVVSLSCWDPDKEDGGIYQIESYIRAIKKNFSVLLVVEVHLPQKSSIVDDTYAMGADSVCYHIGNLCSHGHSQAEPERDKEFEMRMLKHAVSDYPPGTILAHITIGPIGDKSNTTSKEDIEELCKLKVLPILTIENINDAHEMQMMAEQVAELYAFVYEKAKKYQIKMNWFSKLSPFMSPFEGRFFAGDIPRFKLALMNFYQSRILGGSISVGLSNLRRKLRVQEVDSKQESHD
jgi:hypothetical protein